MKARILVTGSRHWTDEAALASAMVRALRWLWPEKGQQGVVLVHGAAKGADQMAARLAAQHGWEVEAHPADWGAHGKGAGPQRNQAMVDAGADILLVCPVPGSRGTWDCMKRAVEAGIPVYVVNPKEGR